MNLPEAAVVIYGALVTLGGLIGYLKGPQPAFPRPGPFSLERLSFSRRCSPAPIAGSRQTCRYGWFWGLTVLSLYRLNRTRRFMPAGLLVLLGAVVAAILLATK